MKTQTSFTRRSLLSRFRTRFCAWVLVLAAVSTALADYQLGSFSLSYKPAKPLYTNTPLRLNLAGGAPRIGFVGRVGGVAFDATAKPEAGFEVKDLMLDYNPAKPDGQRLILKVNGNAVTVQIPDWQLVPIVRYAASDSTSCFTFFGELASKEDEENLADDGARFLNYDTAFRDTLLGLRLFQLDVLLLDSEFATDLPADSGKYILGSGEKAPDRRKNLSILRIYERERDRLVERGTAEEGGFDTDFQSYVLCDHDVPISFSTKGGSLSISGEPFYYFWNSDEEAIRLRLLTAEAVKRGLVAKGTDPDRLSIRLALAASELEDKPLELAAFQQRVDAAVAAATAAGEKARAEGKVKTTYLKKYSEEHAKITPRLAAVNEPVWNAARATMRYGAFFRYCKTSHPVTWAAFAKKMAEVKLPPPVPGFKTPTVLQDSAAAGEK